MRFRLILVVLIFLPVLANAQTATWGSTGQSTWGELNKGPKTKTVVDPNNPIIGTENGIIMYSKGKMYVGYKTGEANKGATSSTALYIDGSAIFVDGATIEQKGRTEITEDFINAKTPTFAGVSGESADYNKAERNLFIYKPSGTIDPNAVAGTVEEGVVAFVGKDAVAERNNKQVIYGMPETSSGAFVYNNVYNSHAKPGGNWMAQKQANYIKFPTIAIKDKYTGQSGEVEVDWSGAIHTRFLHAPQGRFSILAAYGNDYAIHSGLARIDGVTGESGTAALDGKTTALATYSQVRLGLYKFTGNGSTNDDGFMTHTSDPYEADEENEDGILEKVWRDKGKVENLASGNTLRNSDYNRLTGFTPPFVELGADYMFYHLLTEPGLNYKTNKVSVAKNGQPIVDPFTKLQSGHGYFTSMEVSHVDHMGKNFDFHIDEHWDFEDDNAFTSTSDYDKPHTGKGIHHTRRARGGYRFNREEFEDWSKAGGLMENFSRFTATGYTPPFSSGDPKFFDEDGKNRSRVEPMANEKFNTNPNGVVIALNEGKNYLGNPFMAPISLNPILGLNPDGTTLTSVNNYLGNVAVSSTKASGTIRDTYWLVNNARIKRKNPSSTDPTSEDYYGKLHFQISYDYVSGDGSTASEPVGTGHSGSNIAKPNMHLIAPMQMFIVEAGPNTTLTLKPSLQTFGNTGATMKHPKSAGIDPIMHDWFVVEAQNEKLGTADRTSIVFREDAYISYNGDRYDTKKAISDDVDLDITDTKGVSTRTQSTSPEALVYTKSSDNVKLLGNGIPLRTREMPLYFKAPSERQEITLKFYNIENVDNVESMWLIDEYENKKERITSDLEYTFISNPSDSKAADGSDASRFTLRFYDTDDDDVIGGDDESISCYYNSSVLYIRGLNDGDINSDVQIFDMQGRLMGKTRVNDSPKMQYMKPLSIGTYIVKISGNRNYTSKFVNLQN
ncbi:MAG: T9SS type A sorting domain-containing protein [Dysgonomonas sp.]|nr:T9SS type A sorting domain-containing protein [Dysgonomonas sp.]